MKKILIVAMMISAVYGDTMYEKMNEEFEQDCYSSGGMIDQDGYCDFSYRPDLNGVKIEDFNPTMDIKGDDNDRKQR